MIDEKIILACKKQQREAQKQVYNILAPKIYALCKRYLKKEEEIEEVMADSFYIIFTKIEQLKENNAFVGWCKKITVNECLRQLKQNINFNLYLEDTKIINLAHDETDSSLLENDLLQLLKLLPDGCKTIFNLFVIEGYSHKEIAQQLQISEGTSKSQLNVAKTKLKELVQLHFYHQAK